MGKTKPHKTKGKFKATGEYDQAINLFFDRHDFEVGEVRNKRNKLKYKNDKD